MRQQNEVMRERGIGLEAAQRRSILSGRRQTGEINGGVTGSLQVPHTCSIAFSYHLGREGKFWDPSLWFFTP